MIDIFSTIGNNRFLKHYILETCNPKLIELIFKSVLVYLDVFSYWHYLLNNFKSKRYTQQRPKCSSSYKVVMCIRKLHRFCNTSSPDDDLKLGRKYMGNKHYGKYINQFPPNIIKSIRQYERINKKICRQKMFIIFNEIYIYIYVCVCVCVYMCMHAYMCVSARICMYVHVSVYMCEYLFRRVCMCA